MIIVSRNQVVLPSFLETMIKGDEWRIMTASKQAFIQAQIFERSLSTSIASTIETKPSYAPSYSDFEERRDPFEIQDVEDVPFG